MGYMDLSVMGSDKASDAACTMMQAMIKALVAEAKDPGNEINTDGVTNVALIFDEFIIPAGEAYVSMCDEKFHKLLKGIIEGMKDRIKAVQESNDDDWSSDDGKEYHLKTFKRLITRLQNFEKKVAEAL